MQERALVASVNWNGLDVLPGMMDSLLPQLAETGSRLLVFDNASSDGSVDFIEQRAGLSGAVSVVRSTVNIGFGRAANEIIGETAAPIVVLVNTDTIFRPGSLERLLSSVENRPEVGLAGPRLLWPDGSLQTSRRGFPFPGNLVREHLPFFRERTARFGPHDRAGYTDWLVGAVMAVRAGAFLDAGGFSSDFGFFHEETDLMFRMARLGWRVWFEPSAEVIHLCGHTARRLYGGPLALRYIPAKLLFLRKHGGPLSLATFRVLMTCLLLGRRALGMIQPESGPDRHPSEGCLGLAMRAVWSRPYPGVGAPPGSQAGPRAGSQPEARSGDAPPL